MKNLENFLKQAAAHQKEKSRCFELKWTLLMAFILLAGMVYGIGQPVAIPVHAAANDYDNLSDLDTHDWPSELTDLDFDFSEWDELAPAEREAIPEFGTGDSDFGDNWSLAVDEPDVAEEVAENEPAVDVTINPSLGSLGVGPGRNNQLVKFTELGQLLIDNSGVVDAAFGLSVWAGAGGNMPGLVLLAVQGGETGAVAISETGMGTVAEGGYLDVLAEGENVGLFGAATEANGVGIYALAKQIGAYLIGENMGGVGYGDTAGIVGQTDSGIAGAAGYNLDKGVWGFLGYDGKGLYTSGKAKTEEVFEVTGDTTVGTQVEGEEGSGALINATIRFKNVMATLINLGNGDPAAKPVNLNIKNPLAIKNLEISQGDLDVSGNLVIENNAKVKFSEGELGANMFIPILNTKTANEMTWQGAPGISAAPAVSLGEGNLVADKGQIEAMQIGSYYIVKDSGVRQVEASCGMGHYLVSCTAQAVNSAGKEIHGVRPDGNSCLGSLSYPSNGRVRVAAICFNPMGDCAAEESSVDECSDSLDNDCDGLVDGIDPDCCNIDDDQDGYKSEVCGGNDCDDSEATVFPGAAELCDGLDNDCDGVIPADETDGDGDGFMVCEDDCDDNNDTVYTGATEVCDGVDNNCNNNVDEDPAASTECDDGLYCTGAESCLSPNCVSDGNPCDDGNNCTDDNCKENSDSCTNVCNATEPGDACCSDADCASAAACDCTDTDGDTYSPDGGACGAMDCDDNDDLIYPGANERCNGEDDDCDGVEDEDFAVEDICNEGVGVCLKTGEMVCTANGLSVECNVSAGLPTETPEVTCDDGLDNDCDGLTDGADSNCGGAVVNCSDFNNSCDNCLNAGCEYCVKNNTCYEVGICDDNWWGGRNCEENNACRGGGHGGSCPVPPSCDDNDGDGYGDPANAICTHPELDCDDGDAAVNPGASEICDNLMDDDCDGLVDCDDTVDCPAALPECQVQECLGTDSSCGAHPNCEDCSVLDPCDGEKLLSWYCHNNSECRYIQADDCDDHDYCVDEDHKNYYCDSGTGGCEWEWDYCSTECGDYGVDESLTNNNCADNIDNDCDSLEDENDPGCQTGCTDEDGDGYCVEDGDCNDDSFLDSGDTDFCIQCMSNDCVVDIGEYNACLGTDTAAPCGYCINQGMDESYDFDINNNDWLTSGGDPCENWDTGDPLRSGICCNGIDDDCDGFEDQNDPDCLAPQPTGCAADGYDECEDYEAGYIRCNNPGFSGAVERCQKPDSQLDYYCWIGVGYCTGDCEGDVNDISCDTNEPDIEPCPPNAC